MQEAICNFCGANVIFSAKFCRQCGNRLDGSELTTRTLEAPNAELTFEHPTRPANAGFTSPTYPPAVIPPVIGSAPPPSNKTALFVILGIVVTLLIGIGVVGFLVFGRFMRPALPPPPITEKAPPPMGNPGIAVPQPPQKPPEPPPPGRVKTSLDASLIYPGAEVVTDVKGDDGGVTQLHTGDDLDKVVDWYVEKVKPRKHVNMPGGVLLDGDSIKVLIMSGGDETSIQVIRKGKGSE